MPKKEMAELVFELYPDIEKAYSLYQKLPFIFNQNKDKVIAMTKLARLARGGTPGRV